MTETNTDEWYYSKERRDRLTNSFSACYGVDASQWHGLAYFSLYDNCWRNFTGNASCKAPQEFRDFPRKEGEDWLTYTSRFFENFLNKEEHKMYVYDVVVVYKPDDDIVYDNSITAATSEQAKMFALADIMRESAPTNEVIANYHFAVKQVGEGYSK